MVKVVAAAAAPFLFPSVGQDSNERASEQLAGVSDARVSWLFLKELGDGDDGSHYVARELLTCRE